MGQFNFRNKIITLLNAGLGINIASTDNDDDVTAFDAIKAGVETSLEANKNLIAELTEKTKGYDELKKQVEDLTSAAATAEAKANTQAEEITKMKADFDKRLTTLRSEIATELSKEKPEANGESTTVLEEGAKPEVTKTIKADKLWKDNQAPEATVRH